MMLRPIITSLFVTCLAAQEEAADHLRFTNGDQLQGHFAGIDANGKISWERPDIAKPIELQREKVRQIVLRGARALSPMSDPCHVTLINGDRIPGKVVAADENEFTLETTAAGVLTLTIFIGLTVFAVAFGLRPTGEGGPSIVALAARTAFGSGSPLFYTFAASTAPFISCA